MGHNRWALAQRVPKVNAPWKRKRRLNASAVNRQRLALYWVTSLFIVRQFRSIVKRACSLKVDQIIINTGNIWHGLNIVGRKRRQQNRFFSIWSSWTFHDLLRQKKQSVLHFESGVWAFLDGEFDPGSGRTLAACLTHASRTMKWSLLHGLVANGWGTREKPASDFGITNGNVC